MQLLSHWFQTLEAGPYYCRLAQTSSELEQAQKLRFEVFNLELNEGLETAFATGRDEDPFDAVCDHLIVQEKSTGEIIGTYRLQSGADAKLHLGYYSEQEFDFTPYETIRSQTLELGRACIQKTHRNLASLGLLWKGIASYANHHQLRYLIGCSSLTSQDPAEGMETYRLLRDKFLAPAALRTQPHPDYACVAEKAPETRPDIPKLLRAYLTVGARICGPPALDRAFGTIDFLTLLDLKDLSPRNLRRYF